MDSTGDAYLSGPQSALGPLLLSCLPKARLVASMARTPDKRKAKHGAGSTGSWPKRQRVDKEPLEAGGRDEFFVEDEAKEDASGSEPDAGAEEAETAEEKRLRLGAALALTLSFPRLLRSDNTLTSTRCLLGVSTLPVKLCSAAHCVLLALSFTYEL